MTDAKRQQFEADCAAIRIVELEHHPVRGSFDAAHLREINRRIFQDMPDAGFADVTPGVFRSAVPAGREWMKNRTLFTVEGVFYVAYSRMDADALALFDTSLDLAQPAALRELDAVEFVRSMAALYRSLDYIHPFSDGNSRTLRTFTRQLARAAGYELAWEKFGDSPARRDRLYIARDCAVNELATPRIQNEASLRKIIYSRDRLADNPSLSTLLADIVRVR